jgi:branched-subunit amino acid transport protein
MSPWPLIALLGVGTLAVRSVVVLLYGERALPAAVERISGLLAPAIIAAMLAGSVWSQIGRMVGAGGEGSFERLVALGVGAGVAVRTNSVGWTLVAGVAAFALVSGILGAF